MKRCINFFSIYRMCNNNKNKLEKLYKNFLYIKKLDVKNKNRGVIMAEDKKSNKDIELDDTTKYGEFISSYFAWIPLEMQKEKAKSMEKMTKRKKP